MNIQIFGTSKSFDTKLEAMINPKHPDAALLERLASDQAKLDHLFEDPSLLNAPIVRNGKQATVGYCPQVWETWT